MRASCVTRRAEAALFPTLVSEAQLEEAIGGGLQLREIERCSIDARGLATRSRERLCRVLERARGRVELMNSALSASENVTNVPPL
ncbi:MAG: hypothetical protein ABTQ32_12500 [Myxococcaceae bacterium]